jgi:uncharacterized membrane protein (DUF2068 family)
MNKKITMIIIVLIALAIGVWDLFLARDTEPGNTISSVLLGQGWAAALAGFIVVHLFNRTKAYNEEKVSLIAGLVAVGVGQTITMLGLSSLLSLGVGGVLAYFFWGNTGES